MQGDRGVYREAENDEQREAATARRVELLLPLVREAHRHAKHVHATHFLQNALHLSITFLYLKILQII